MQQALSCVAGAVLGWIHWLMFTSSVQRLFGGAPNRWVVVPGLLMRNLFVALMFYVLCVHVHLLVVWMAGGFVLAHLALRVRLMRQIRRDGVTDPG
jgi:hypothetical protein